VSAEPVLDVADLVVEYDGTTALRGVTLSVAPGEVLALLGPSGSGKSTLLHAVAGFLVPRAGSVRLAGRTVVGGARPVPPERRDLAVVFQNYALWPHLSALDTVAYPARRRGAGRTQARAEALELLRRLRIDHLAARRPAELSGGEQQRVGLARALARQPSLYLFDEPTAHLDTHVRAVFLEELVARQRDSGAAAVYATHDAEEALGLADRVALLRDGELLQVGTPRQVYDEPADLFTARLTGPASVIDAPDTTGRLLVRPGWAHLGGPLEGRLRAVWFRGPHSDHLVQTPLGEVLIRENGPPRHPVGACTGWTLVHGWPIDG
jgi:iron(III) transport system ATP-binding protein